MTLLEHRTDVDSALPGGSGQAWVPDMAEAPIEARTPGASTRSFSDFLLQQSRQLGLTVTEICKRADITRETWYRLTRGDVGSPTVQLVARLAAALRVSPLALLQLAYANCRALHRPASARLQPDHYSFVRDVTVPDGMPVLPGQRFVKSWEIQNTSCEIWEGRELRCVDEDMVLCRRDANGALQPMLDANLRPTARSVALPRTLPREVVSLSVEFQAPTVPGTVMSLWKLFDRDGRVCHPDYPGLWTKVVVASL